MPQGVSDLKKIVELLQDQEVRFVLVGGMAVTCYGGATLTDDVDFAVAYDPENVEAIVSALAPVHPRPLRLARGAQWVWDRLCVRPPRWIFMTDLGRLDLILRLPGVDNFEGLYHRASLLKFDSIELRVASTDDLISMKSVANREKDKIHIQTLNAIKSLQAESNEHSNP